MMELQALIQLVSEYHPGGETSASRSSLLTAVRQLKIALSDIEKVGEGIRPLVKALVTASVYLPEEWEDILKVLRGVLANNAVPWLHRAFLLKALPGMFLDAPVERRSQYGDALCEVLVHWSIPPPESEEADTQNTQGEALQSPNPQERRVALTALLSLQEECSASIVEKLTAQLPHSLSACVSIVSSSSAQEGLKRAFELWLCHPSQSVEASCTLELQKALKEHFRDYGGLRCEQLCAALVSQNPPKNLTELDALQKQLLALEEMGASHCNIVGKRVPLAFLLAKVAEVLNFIYSSEQNCLEKSVRDFTVPLSVIQLLVQLTDVALATPDSLNSQELEKVSACLVAIESADAALDAPLPIIECVLHLVLRALPCVSTTDEGVRSLLNEIFRVAGTLLPVVEEAVLKIHSAAPLLREQQHAVDFNTKTDGKEGSTQATHPFLTALRVAQTVAQLCRICRKKLQPNRAKPRDEEGSHNELRDIAAAVRCVTPSWRREKTKTQPLQAPANPHSRRVVADVSGIRKEPHHSYKQPRHGDRGGGHPPLRRRRREAPPM
ncbi:hypothetical protein TraAM80_08109 [Trypanosoma rangeli]|uniref:Uncharacterized protein n=1 Tax=Trypanosoma rangeli TaxID=5698 RepID=A0A422N294_TRYRA|nr:uncharacterized protein TraAM80_08109 [Trypanosoma rangeli]RNE99575.1 hypothetical protein TraAM80_08109 [Trypanosoma rangeli]|eukprot:RNE99575.1 hypothetical protein TraAM80_08109 [Trypanosoma rangeli]